MYFLERKESYSLPNILGNCSFPVRTFRWKAIIACEIKEPLLKELNKLNKEGYRITNNEQKN